MANNRQGRGPYGRRPPPTRHANNWPKVGNLPLQEIIHAAGANPQWDVLLLGDGSGYPDAQHAGGYACVIVDSTGHRDLVVGSGRMPGHMAELAAPLHGLIWYEQSRGRQLREACRRRVLNVVVISDNQAVVTVGRRGGIYQGGDVSMAPYWFAWAGTQTMGYASQWYLAPRDFCDLHKVVDHASRTARLDLDALIPGLPEGSGLSWINPLAPPPYTPTHPPMPPLPGAT